MKVHGSALGCIDGCPPQVEITEGEIQSELDKRRPGQSDVTTQRNEKDKVEILSVFSKKNSRNPIGLGKKIKIKFPVTTLI